jgi:hypothetical protein
VIFAVVGIVFFSEKHIKRGILMVILFIAAGVGAWMLNGRAQQQQQQQH